MNLGIQGCGLGNFGTHGIRIQFENINFEGGYYLFPQAIKKPWKYLFKALCKATQILSLGYIG